MKAILNLANIKKPTLPVELPGGGKVELLPASKALIDKMQAAGTANLGSGLLYSLAADILSCNTENRVFSVDELAGLDIFAIKTLFTAYKNFILGINSDPN